MVHGPIRSVVLKLSKPPVPLIPLIHVSKSFKKHPHPIVPLYSVSEGRGVGSLFRDGKLLVLVAKTKSADQSIESFSSISSWKEGRNRRLVVVEDLPGNLRMLSSRRYSGRPG
jgi:hypothetical protein